MNAFFSLVKNDSSLTTSHVCLYMALFQYWNYNRFQNPFPVYRDNIMRLSKIGSKNTYHKCIKELHEAKYIYYHPAPSRFLPVKVSIGRLDIQEEPTSRYKQLDLFNISEKTLNNKRLTNLVKPGPPLSEGDLGGGLSTNNDTGSVPILGNTSTDNDTGTVSNMGHNIKDKHFNKTESKTPSQKIFDKNEKLSKGINSMAEVPIVGHACHPEHNQVKGSFPEGYERSSEGSLPPFIGEVEDFFKLQSYPVTEAKKFYNHYKAIGWKIKGITPIEDWQAAAHKWMINTNQWDTSKGDSPHPSTGSKDIPGFDLETLYKQFQEGKNIFRHITPGHFNELNLQLSEEIINLAKKERINQLTGSNQNSILRLLNAYLDNKENDPLIINDNENLITLSKRIAVLKNFSTQKINTKRNEH